MLRKSTQELSSIRIRVALKADSPILPFVREALSQAKLDLSLSHAACRVSILFENVNLISFLPPTYPSKKKKEEPGTPATRAFSTKCMQNSTSFEVLSSSEKAHQI